MDINPKLWKIMKIYKVWKKIKRFFPRIYFNASCKENIMHFCTFFDAKFNQSFVLKTLTREVPLPIRKSDLFELNFPLVLFKINSLFLWHWLSKLEPHCHKVSKLFQSFWNTLPRKLTQHNLSNMPCILSGQGCLPRVLSRVSQVSRSAPKSEKVRSQLLPDLVITAEKN